MGNVVSEICCSDKERTDQNNGTQSRSGLTKTNYGNNNNGITPGNPDSELAQLKPQGEMKIQENNNNNKMRITPPNMGPPPGNPQQPLKDAYNSGRGQGSNPEPSQPQTGEKKKISPDDFELIKVIGRGSFGKVHLARYKWGDKRQLVALKKLKKKEVEERMQVENVLTEKKILQKADHPFIVKLIYAFQNEGNIYLAMEYMPGGELFFHLRNSRRFGEPAAIFYASEVLLGLEYLHTDLGVIYRDLKPENILLDSDGHIKITDFGLSKMDKLTNSFCGTPEYFAPEIIMGSGYGKEVDWWSFGCFIYEIMVGRPPFQDPSRTKLYKMIIEGKVHYPDRMSLNARDLISKLLNPNPEQRLGAKDATEVKNHPFFASVNWVKVRAKEVKPPFRPTLKGETDITNFDTTYTNENVRETPVAPAQLKYPEFTYVTGQDNPINKVQQQS